MSILSAGWTVAVDCLELDRAEAHRRCSLNSTQSDVGHVTDFLASQTLALLFNLPSAMYVHHSISYLFCFDFLSFQNSFRIFRGFFQGFFFSGDFSPLLSATFLMICFIFVCFQLVEIFPLCFLLFLSRCHAPRSCKILGGSFEDSLTFPRSQRSRATCNHKSFIISGFQGFFLKP